MDFSSIMDTYLENRRRLATIPTLPLLLPPPPPASATTSAAKHPLFGPIPPHLLHKYLSPTLSISTYDSPLHSSPSHPPPPLSNIYHPPSPHPSSSSSSPVKPVSPAQLCSSPFTQIYMATIEDDPSQPSLKKDDIVTLNTCPHPIIIDDIDTSFCHLLTEDYSFFFEGQGQGDDTFSLAKEESFSLQEISATAFVQSLEKGSVLSKSNMEGKKVSDNPVSRKRKSDAIHFGSHDYNTRCKAKKCF